MSRELDALVAEKVMGYHRHPNCDLKEHGVDEECWGSGPDEGYGTLMPYSTDIAAAWEVVEKLRRDGLWFAVKQDNTDLWDAKVWRSEAKGWFPTAEYCSTVESAPLAICLAALKAVGVEVPV